MEIGRKRYDVPFAIVCKALQACCGNYSAAARWIFEETGIKVSPGFVQTRMQREDKTLVALHIQCTKCGKETWWGWWPEK